MESDQLQPQSLVQTSLAGTAGVVGEKRSSNSSFFKTCFYKESWELPPGWVDEREGPAESSPWCLCSAPPNLGSLDVPAATPHPRSVT